MGKIYVKGVWVDESLAGVERYDILTDLGAAIESNVQINLATPVALAGSPLTAARMNNIENGIDLLDTMLATPGWFPAPGTFTFSSLDSPIGVLSADVDLETFLSKGMRLKYDQDHALTVYWNMDSNSNSQVGAHNGTDTAVTYTAGKFGNAATFNGTTSKIVVADHANLKPTGEFTLGLWFKSNTTGTSKFLFQSYSSNPNYAGFHLRIGVANTLEAVFGKNTGTGIGSDVVINTGKTVVTDNILHFAVLTYRNNIVQIYLDGVLELQGWTVAPAYAGTNYVRIGCANVTGADTFFMNGQIDDVFLINGYALDEKLIRAKYLAQTAQGTGNITVAKMGIVHDVGVFSGGASLLTLYGGTDFQVANSAISNVFYSPYKAPLGFNLAANKWSGFVIDLLDRGLASPVANTIYNIAGLSISVPIGLWWLSFNVENQSSYNIASILFLVARSGLSTATNTLPFTDLIGEVGASQPIAASVTIRASLSRTKLINLAAKTTFYLNSQINQSGGLSISYRGDLQMTQIMYESAYL